jgi:hypothetical protein
MILAMQREEKDQNEHAQVDGCLNSASALARATQVIGY